MIVDNIYKTLILICPELTIFVEFFSIESLLPPCFIDACGGAKVQLIQKITFHALA